VCSAQEASGSSDKGHLLCERGASTREIIGCGGACYGKSNIRCTRPHDNMRGFVVLGSGDEAQSKVLLFRHFGRRVFVKVVFPVVSVERNHVDIVAKLSVLAQERGDVVVAFQVGHGVNEENQVARFGEPECQLKMGREEWVSQE